MAKNDLMQDVAKVIHEAKRRHLRNAAPMPKDAAKEQRQLFLAAAVEDQIASRTIAELQGDLAKLFRDQERFANRRAPQRRIALLQH